uniref:Uncharacterized protein n=1 Tax=Helianthus annuus TaxID=4232 RepID=A0A251TMU4_HELAN
MGDLKVILNNRNVRDLIRVPATIPGHITMAVAQEFSTNEFSTEVLLREVKLTLMMNVIS